MDTIEDIDEDEAFINELMALHPNDEDIIVEDIEATEHNLPTTIPPSIIDHETIRDNNNVSADENDEDDGVRKMCFWVFFLSYRLKTSPF